MTSYLNLNEAVEATGLNAKTLVRFIEAGYIQTRESNEEKLLSIFDLNKTFGLNISKEESPSDSALKIEITNIKPEDSNTIETVSQNYQPADLAKSDTPPQMDQSILEKVIALQDRLLEDKDSQLNEQQKEIRWLRTRIEKLEEQSEKDKILLLSGNQTINRLIELNNGKQSWLSKTITWLSSKE